MSEPLSAEEKGWKIVRKYQDIQDDVTRVARINVELAVLWKAHIRPDEARWLLDQLHSAEEKLKSCSGKLAEVLVLNFRFKNELKKLREDICKHADDTVWVGPCETACERITQILGDDWTESSGSGAV